MAIQPSSTYQWRNVRRRDLERETRSTGLGRWVILAVVCSLAIHLLLIFLFSDIRIALPGFQDSREALFSLPRIEVDQRSLEASAPADDLPRDLDPANSPEAFADPTLDILSLQEQIPDDREIKLTPGVDAPENFGPAAMPEALASLDADALEEGLKSIDQAAPDLPAEARRLSEDQLVIDLPDGPAEGDTAGHLLDEAVGGDVGLADRFTTVEKLLDLPGGKVTDTSKPIFMPTDLLFDFNEWRLRTSAKSSLMMLGVLIDRNRDTIFIIEGHTDTIGGEPSNLELSRKRAEAVRDWLTESLRLEPGRLRVSALGESRPLVNPEGSIEEQQANRRVEIRMLKDGEKLPPPAPAPPAGKRAPPEEAPPEIRPAVPVRPATPAAPPRARPVEGR